MKNNIDIIALNDRIQQAKSLLQELQSQTDSFPAILKNSKRALASLKMMELNVSDLVEFGVHEQSH
jgi:hypothetical protein